jgi:hypothetical protein
MSHHGTGRSGTDYRSFHDLGLAWDEHVREQGHERPTRTGGSMKTTLILLALTISVSSFAGTKKEKKVEKGWAAELRSKLENKKYTGIGRL